MRLKLKHLSKSFACPVIKDISYTFESGKLYVIKGISGCGKTTLLNILGGVITDYGGEIQYSGMNGKTIRHSGINDSGVNCGYIFQKSLLLSGISLHDNLRLISSDEGRIEELSNILGIGNLLECFPEQLSGGERQRAAVVRALLNDPVLLLADEPTASLDGENSCFMSNLLASLKDDSRIIIVATHEAYFDEYADQIIYLDYGTIGQVEINPIPRNPGEIHVRKSETGMEAISNRKTMKSGKAEKGKTDRWKKKEKEAWSRREKKAGIKLFPLVFCILVLFLISVVQNNIAGEAMRFYTEKYPTSIVLFPTEALRQLENRENLEIYEYYVAEENNVTAYYRMPAEYSVLNIPGVITCGNFPDTGDEVLVSRAFAEEIAVTAEQSIGRKIYFKNHSFTVCGIVGNIWGDFRNDDYYRFNKDGEPFGEEDKFLIVSYDILKKIGEKRERSITMCVAPGLSGDIQLQKQLKKAGTDTFNQYFADAEKLQQQVDFYAMFLYIIMMILFVLCCIFLSSILRTELFYRNRELGYLQIFGLSSERVRQLITDKYLIKFQKAVRTAVISGIFLTMLYGAILGNMIWPNVVHVMISVFALYIVYMGTVRRTVKKYLEISIITLIS